MDSMSNHTPLRAIENVDHSDSDLSPGKIFQYNKCMKRAREAAEAGQPKKSLELLKQAAAIQKTDKVLKRIEKVEAFLAANSESEDEDNGLVHLGKGYHLMKDVHDKLYPYQRECLLWFWRLHRKMKGGILGDDMGLGKTIQVVAFLTGLFDMQQVKSVLIVLPVAVIINWEREFEKWSPGINIQCFHGSSKREKERALAKVQRRGGVLLTSYGLVLTSFKQMVQHDGSEFIWDYIILDEGHKIKNPGKTTKAVHSIPAKHRFILTGTPIQNNLKEMWALFDFVTHGSVLGTIKTFMMEYGNPITRARERDATSSEKLLGNEMAESLRKLIEPYFLRRTKADVLENKENFRDPESSGSESTGPGDKDVCIPRLTKKNDFIIWLYLTDTQIQIYKDFTQLDQVKELLMTQRSPLAELTVLKKLCDHPRLLSARACQQLGLQTTEDIEHYSDEDENRGHVTDTGAGACNIKDIDDEILMAESGKLQFLFELLHNLTDEGHRTLVFSQSRKMLDIVEKILRNRNFKFMRLDGTVSKLTDREQRIKCFQSNQSYTVFLLTTQVGGVGLTLTGADRVVIIDPSWNPATDAQAVDRAYRIGQKKSVVIYRLITCGTVEEKIYRRQIFKDSITKQATGASKNPYRYFSRQDLKELFILDDPKRSKTQEQLEEMHSAHRKSDTELDSHIAFLHSLDSIYGLSDHDLMFSQEAKREENEGFETETDDYIQRRVQRAQDLVSAESDLTVQLKEQLESNTQPAGLQTHSSEINMDRARLKKTWEQVHGVPDQKEILRPGADYEERYVSKKRPEPEYDLTNESSGEDSDVILDHSGMDADIESVSPKSSVSSANNSHQGSSHPAGASKNTSDDQNASSILIEDSEEEKEDPEGSRTEAGFDNKADTTSSPLPALERNIKNRNDVPGELDVMDHEDGRTAAGLNSMTDISASPLPAFEGNVEASNGTPEPGTIDADKTHRSDDSSLIEGADMDIQCDLGNTTCEESAEDNSTEKAGAFQENGSADMISSSSGKLPEISNLKEMTEDYDHSHQMEPPTRRSSRLSSGGVENGNIMVDRSRESYYEDQANNRRYPVKTEDNNADDHRSSEGSITDEEPIMEAADFEIQCELGTTVFEDTDDEGSTGDHHHEKRGHESGISSESKSRLEESLAAEEELNESVNMMRDMSINPPGEEDRPAWDVPTSTPSKESVVREQSRKESMVQRRDSMLPPKRKPMRLVDDSDDDSDQGDVIKGRAEPSAQSFLVVESDDQGPSADVSQASMVAESDCDISAIQESFQEIMELNDSIEDPNLDRGGKLFLSTNHGQNHSYKGRDGDIAGPVKVDQDMGSISGKQNGVAPSRISERNSIGNKSSIHKEVRSPEDFFEARDYLKTPAAAKPKEDRDNFGTPRESFGTPRENFGTPWGTMRSSLSRWGSSKENQEDESKGMRSAEGGPVVNGLDGEEDVVTGRDVFSNDHEDERRKVDDGHFEREGRRLDRSNDEVDVSMVSHDGTEDVLERSVGIERNKEHLEHVHVDENWYGSVEGSKKDYASSNFLGSEERYSSGSHEDDNPLKHNRSTKQEYSDGADENASNNSYSVQDDQSRGREYLNGFHEDNNDYSRRNDRMKEEGYPEGAREDVGSPLQDNPGEEDDDDYADEYACSEELEEEQQEKYYQLLDKGEQYLENGRKTKALKYFLMALNVDNTSHALQLRTYSLAQEREQMKAQGQQV